MIYLALFFTLMLYAVIKIEKIIISSKYLIKKAHIYRHETRVFRIEKRKEIEEYKKSLTHQYYVERNSKDPKIKKMLNEIRYKNMDFFRFEARVLYYGYIVSLLFGVFFTLTGLYKNEFISSLYPNLQPYFKVIYSNFDKYTFNPEAFKVCFCWIFIFSVTYCLFYLIYILKFPRKSILMFEKELVNNSEKIRYLISFGLGTWILSLWLIDSSVGDLQRRLMYGLLSYGFYFIYFASIFFGVIIVLITLKKTILDLLKGINHGRKKFFSFERLFKY